MGQKKGLKRTLPRLHTEIAMQMIKDTKMAPTKQETVEKETAEDETPGFESARETARESSDIEG